MSEDFACSISDVVPYELITYRGVKCLVVTWIYGQFKINGAVAAGAYTLQMQGVINDACVFRIQVETILLIAVALAYGRSDERVLCVVHCQQEGDNTVAMIHCAEMLSVASASGVSFVIPNKQVTYSSVQGDVVNRVDGQVVGNSTVAAGSQDVVMADNSAFSIVGLVPYKLSAYGGVECQVVTWVNSQFQINGTVTTSVHTLQM